MGFSSRESRRLTGIAALIAVAAVSVAGRAESSEAGEWPGLWGPNRNARVAGPLKLGPGAAVKEVWRRPIGKGYSEIAAVGGRGFTMFSDGEIDHLTAIDLATGKEVWRSRMEATHRGHDGSGDGALSTPVASGGRVFALEAGGKLFAFDAATGRELWQRDLTADFGAQAPWYGFATTPLPVGETLVVQTGAESDNLVALEQATGKTVWTSQPASQNGYSSPVLTTLAGVPQIVAATSDKLFAVDPEDGSVLWDHPAIAESRQSPVFFPEGRILITTWDESAVFEVTRAEETWKVEELWKKPILKATYSPAVFHEGHIYGMNRTYLTCLDAETGDVKWRHKVYNASLILVDGHLAILGEKSGNFHLVEADPEGYREKLRFRVFNPGAQSITGPMYVAGRFLLRNGEEIVMLELAEGSAGEGEERTGS